MSNKITRRHALKLGTGAALSLDAPWLASANTNTAVIRMNHPSEQLCLMRAVDLVEALRRKKVSAREVMQAHLKQVRRVNGKVNALVTSVPEDELMAQAAAADESLAKGNWLGPLHGLPIGMSKKAASSLALTWRASKPNVPRYFSGCAALKANSISSSSR